MCKFLKSFVNNFSYKIVCILGDFNLPSVEWHHGEDNITSGAKSMSEQIDSGNFACNG